MAGFLPQSRADVLEAFSRALVRESHILKDHPTLLWQQLYNRLQTESKAVVKMLENELKNRSHPGRASWIQLKNPYRESEALVRTLEGHKECVTSCLISPDNSFIVSCGLDNTVKIWDWGKGTVRFSLADHVNPVKTCAVSQNSVFIGSLSSEALIVWDASTGERRLKIPQKLPHVFAISPDNRFILAEGQKYTFSMWDLNDGQKLWVFKGHKKAISDLAICLDRNFIVSASFDQTLKVWDIFTGDERFTLIGHRDAVICCSVSPDGKFIVSGSRDKALKVWDAATGEALFTLGGHTEPIRDCTISPDGSYIVSQSEDQSLKIWDTSAGIEKATLSNHSMAILSHSISPDGKYIVSASGDRTIKIWEGGTGTEKSTLLGHTMAVEDCAISPDGKYIVSASDDQTLKLWDIEETIISNPNGHSNSIATCKISPNGSFLTSASTDHTLKLWDSTTGEECFTLTGHQDYVNCCSISPDGKFIVSCSRDKSLKVWNPITGEEIATLVGHNEGVHLCKFSPDSKYIVSASYDLTLKIWDTNTWQEKATLIGHTKTLNDFAISSDCSFIVSASNDRNLIVWDAVTGRNQKTLTGHYGEPIGGGFIHGGEVFACDISPDNSFIISASSDKTLKKWEITTKPGKRKYWSNTLIGHHDWVYACKISPDNNFMVSASKDKTMKIWDLSTGQERLTITGHTDEVRACEITQDARYIISANHMNLKVWNATTGNELASLPYWGANVYITLHPWLPIVISGDQGGVMNILELVNIKYGPLIITAVDTSNGPWLRCPACQYSFPLQKKYLDTMITCPQINCSKQLKVNPFVTKILGKSK